MKKTRYTFAMMEATVPLILILIKLSMIFVKKKATIVRVSVIPCY